MKTKPSITRRVLNLLSFSQKFIFICLLFALCIGTLTVLLVLDQNQELAAVRRELAAVEYDRPIMLLTEYLIEEQQTLQRYLLGDTSLENVLQHLQQRITEAFSQLSDTDHELGPFIFTQEGGSTSWKNEDLDPNAIRTAWENLNKDIPKVTVEDSYNRHLQILNALQKLSGYLADSAGVVPDKEISTYYLAHNLYNYVPVLHQRLMNIAFLAENIVTSKALPLTDRDSLAGSVALLQSKLEEVMEGMWKAIQARKVSNGDLDLKAALEGPTGELSASTENLISLINKNLLEPEKIDATLGTIVVITTRALHESFQFSNIISEQLENILKERVKDLAYRQWVTILTTSILASVVFLLAFVLLKAMFDPLRTLVSAANQLAKGKLNVRVPIVQNDEIGQVGMAFNQMARSIEEILKQLQSAGMQLTTSTTQMAAAAKEQEATIVQQETATKQIAVTAKEISATATDFASTIQGVTHNAEETSSLASTGREALQQMKDIMQQLVNSSTEIANKLATLTDKTNTITGVITTITKVADRTNLLSLNAAIEAHKLGEKGGSFGVIAREIRRLADQTAFATLDIESAVNQMVNSVAASVEGIAQFSEDIRKGVQQANSIHGVLTQIIAQVQSQTNTFETVNQGMDAQSIGARQITESIDELSEVAQQSSTSIRQFHTALDQLSIAIRDLQSTVTRLQNEAKDEPALTAKT